MSSRRAFLKHASAAGAVGLLTRIPGRRLWALPAAALRPEPDETRLRELALTAMDAARAAGASFADIRLTAGRYVSVRCTYTRGGSPGMGTPSIGFPTRYGIRAIVNGAWGFAGGTELTADAIARVARTAVAVARGNEPRKPRTLELAAITPVANGTWATPVEQEPFDVPMGEQSELQLAALHEASKIGGISYATVSFEWRRPTTVFASTEGSLLIQRYAFAAPSGVTSAQVGPSIRDEASAGARGLRSGAYGYEALNGRHVIPAMREAAERAVALARAARTPISVDPGRYDLVFGGSAVVSLITSTLASVVNAELALGYHANGAGISFAAPPDDMLGKFQAAASSITVRCDRTRPGAAATVGWDEEGVQPDAYTVIQDGVIVDYHTTRETAPELGAWYRQRGAPVRAHGIMRRCGSDQPTIALPNLTLDPGPGNTTLDDLIKDVKRGLYVESAKGSVDHQLISAQFRADHTSVRSITNGKLGGYVKDVAFQFITTPFWKSVDAVAGSASVISTATVTDGGAMSDRLQPFPMSTVDVVPVRARQVNVINVGGTA